MKINDFFERVICINPKCNADRWGLAVAEADKHGIVMDRFEGYEGVLNGNGKVDGVLCVSASHRAVLDATVYNKWKSALIFEDDFLFRFEDSQQIFSEMIGEVPSDWDMLFLGGHYAENPIRRISEHVIQTGGMHCVHAYGVTQAFARFAAPRMHGGGAPDSMYCNWQKQLKSYIFQPRLVLQRPGVSGCSGRFEDYTGCLTDGRHEAMV